MLKLPNTLALDVALFDVRDIGILLLLAVIGLLALAGIFLLIRHLIRLKKIRDDL